MAQKSGPAQSGNPYLQRQADSGLQPERTALAWYRTTFVCLINSLLLLRNAIKLESLLFWVLSAAMLALTVTLYLYSYVHSANLQTTKELPSRGDLWLKIILAGMVTLCAVALMWYFLSDSLAK